MSLSAKRKSREEKGKNGPDILTSLFAFSLLLSSQLMLCLLLDVCEFFFVCLVFFVLFCSFSFFCHFLLVFNLLFVKINKSINKFKKMSAKPF